MIAKINNNKIIIFIPFLLGIISSFSLPPYSFVFLNFITFPFLYYLLHIKSKQSKIISLFIGWLFGFGYFISSIYWITNSLTFYENFKFLIPLALIVIPLFLGFFYGLATLLFSLISNKKKYSSLLIFATIFSLIEFCRGFIFGGFPWNLIAYSWTDLTNMLQILPYTGIYLFNLLSITFFLIPSVVFFNKSFFSKITTILISLSLLFFNYFYGVLKIESNNEFPQVKLESTFKIISPKIEIERFFDNENPEIIINELIKLSKPNKNNKTIFIFPEGALTGIYLEDLKFYKDIFKYNFSEKHKFLIGINSEEGSKIFNSLVLLDNNLNVISKYDKNKLVPFGEFLPFENIFTKIGLKKISFGYKSFSSSNKREIFNINNINVLPLICYEIIYSGKLNTKKNKNNYDFIVNISEDGWFGDTVGPYQHFSHSKFRAIEEGKYLLRSANNGISAIIDPSGIILKKIKSTNKGFIELNSFRKTKNTLFATYGNKIFFYFIIFYISLIFFLKKIRR